MQKHKKHKKEKKAKKEKKKKTFPQEPRPGARGWGWGGEGRGADGEWNTTGNHARGCHTG